MRAFKLKEEKSFIKVLKEPPLRKKKTNWSRRVYIFIAVCLLFYLVNKVFTGYAIIKAKGQIELPKQSVQFANDIELLGFNVQEGEQVNKGDTLFRYRILPDKLSESSSSMQNKPIDWILKDMLLTEKKIEILKFQISNTQTLLQSIEQRLKISEKLLMNGLHDELNNYNKLTDQKTSLLSTLDQKMIEKEIQLSYLKILSLKEREYKQIQTNQWSLYTELNYFISNTEGVISDIPYENHEICYKKDNVMTIHKMEGASVYAYFDPFEISNLNEGDVVKITFPDNTQSQGKISKFFVSTYALPSEFQKKYEPTERNIVAEVVPLSENESKRWKNYYKMEVDINKKRYDFNL